MLHLRRDRLVQPERAEVAGEDHLARRQLRVDIVRPGGLHQADLVPQRGKVGLAEAVAEDGALAGGGPKVGGEDARQRALAGAVGAEDGAARAGRDGPVDALQDPPLAARHADAAQENRRRLLLAHAAGSFAAMPANVYPRKFVPSDLVLK